MEQPLLKSRRMQSLLLNQHQWRPNQRRVLWFMVLLGAAILPSWSIVSLPSCDASGEQTVWQLKQHGGLAGDFDVYIGMNGYKEVHPKAQFTAVFAGPSWHLIEYNDRGKVFCKLTAQEWFKQSMARQAFCRAYGYTGAEQWLKGPVVQIAHQPAREYDLPTPGTVKDGDVQRIRFYRAETINVAPEITAFWRSDPLQNPKIPACMTMRIVVDVAGQNPQIPIDTSSMEKVTVPANFFCYPSSYKQLPNEWQVVYGADRQLFEDMVDDLGRDLGTKTSGHKNR